MLLHLLHQFALADVGRRTRGELFEIKYHVVLHHLFVRALEEDFVILHRVVKQRVDIAFYFFYFLILGTRVEKSNK